MGVINFIIKNIKLIALIAVIVFCIISVRSAFTTHKNLVESREVLSKAEEVGTEQGKTAGIGAAQKEAAEERKAIEKAAKDEGESKGKEEGKADGLSAKETEIWMNGQLKLKETGKLDVLVAGVELGNFHGYGDKYAALDLMKADAVFSVDLGQAEITKSDNGTISIILLEPEVEVSIDHSQTERIAEWQQHKYIGSAKDGQEAYLNSVKEIVASAPDDLKKNAEMMNSARLAAQEQVLYLAKSIYGADVAISIGFK